LAFNQGIMKKKFLFSIWFWAVTVFIMLWGAGCSKDEDLIPEPVSYTALIYMAADNSMDSEVDYTVEQLKEGAKKSGGTVVVYLDSKNEEPRLFSISAEGTEIPLKSYGEENSASAGTLARVIKETKEMVPADYFGLVYWSHAMGWLPREYTKTLKWAALKAERSFPRTRFLGLDDNLNDGIGFATVMEVDDMADALFDNGLEYIWFDVCLMGGVEALYELRNKCNYLVASPTEVLMEADYDASGIPYAKVLPYLFGGEDDLKQACQIYYNHYNAMKAEILRSETITLIDASQLDGLYNASSAILNGKLPTVSALDVSGLQVYHQGSIPPVFFDLGDVIQQCSTEAKYETFKEKLDKTVLYKAATSQFVDLNIDPDHFSGLSCYVPLSKWKNNSEYTYYFTLDWSGVYNEQ
jgi:hypothetical protein